jgi:antitoxin YefM
MMDRVVNDREVVIIHRKRGQKVAMIPADELAGLVETAHLLRSPKNADRLMKALDSAKRGKKKVQSFDKLRREMGLAESR